MSAETQRHDRNWLPAGSAGSETSTGSPGSMMTYLRGSTTLWLLRAVNFSASISSTRVLAMARVNAIVASMSSMVSESVTCLVAKTVFGE